MNKRANSCSQNSTSQKAAERLEAAADESDYLDKANDDVYGRDEPYDPPPAPPQPPQPDTPEPEQKTEESSVDDQPDEPKSLKRKEPAEDETSPKRQCPEILIE